MPHPHARPRATTSVVLFTVLAAVASLLGVSPVPTALAAAAAPTQPEAATASSSPADPAAPGVTTQHTYRLAGADAMATAPAGPSGSGRALSEPAPIAAPAGWSRELAVAPGTQMIGVSWAGSPAGSVEVRGQTPSGWTAWSALSNDIDERPDQAPDVTAVGPVWFGAAGVDAVDVRVTSGPLANLKLLGIEHHDASPTAPRSAEATPAPTDPPPTDPPRSNSSVGQPPIHLRTEWTPHGWAYSNSGCSGGPITTSLKFAVVHHTVNSNNYSAHDVPAMLAGIYTFHTSPVSSGGRGWCDVAYNFVIDRFGGIWEGRSGGITKAIQGGHSQGFNTNSMGVAFLGQYEPGASPTSAQPSAASVDAAAHLIAWKFRMAGIDPSRSITVVSGGSPRYPAGQSVTIKPLIGHRDIGLTACPGLNLYNQLDHMRSEVVALMASAPPPPPPGNPYAPFATPSPLIDQQYHDALHRGASIAELYGWIAKLGDGWTAGQVISPIVSSDEADQKGNGVIRLYIAAFGRIPDHTGLTYWTKRRATGTDLAHIATALATSAEFVGKYGHLTNQSYASQVYRTVLGRSPDSRGLSFWTDKLNAGTSRGSVLTAFAESSEYRTRMRSQVLIAATFDDLLQREADPSSFWYYVDKFDHGTTLGTIANVIFHSEEYQTRSF